MKNKMTSTEKYFYRCLIAGFAMAAWLILCIYGGIYLVDLFSL